MFSPGTWLSCQPSGIALVSSVGRCHVGQHTVKPVISYHWI